MLWTVTINDPTGAAGTVVLPDGNSYVHGETATLTFEQYQRIDDALLGGLITDGGQVTMTTAAP